MFCKNCGKELSDEVKFCPFCGANLSAETESPQEEIFIFGYNEKFAIKAKVKIYKNGEYIGTIKGNEKFNAGKIDKDTLFEFKSSIRTASVMVSAKNPKNIQLAFDRMTGQLSAYLSDDEYTLQNNLRNKDGRNIAIAIINCSLCFGIYYS